jgi:hypothetical protein
MDTKWKLVVDTEFTVDEDVDEVWLKIFELRNDGNYDVNYHSDGNFFTGYSRTGDSPRGAIDLISRQWKWEIDFEGIKDKDWHVKLLTIGLESLGHTDISFNPEDNSFTGSATEEIELPPSAN